MSHSSSSAGSSRFAAGVFVGREGIAFAQLMRDPEGIRVGATRVAKLADPIFGAGGAAASGPALDAAISAGAGETAGRHVPVHALLPDAAVASLAIELDQVPKQRAALAKLVEARMARELGIRPRPVEVQHLGRIEERQWLLGTAADPEWLSAIGDAFARARVVPWSVRSVGVAVFNHFHDTLVATSGALITLLPESWSLWVWDARGVPRPLRAQWRTHAADLPVIAAEVERTLIAYTDAHSSRGVDKLFLWPARGTRELADLIDARTRDRCTRLEVPNVADGSNMSSGEEVAVLAALTP